MTPYFHQPSTCPCGSCKDRRESSRAARIPLPPDIERAETTTPESRKVLDDYRDSLLGDGVSETARMLVEEHVSQMERQAKRLAQLEKLVDMGSLRVAASGVRLCVFTNGLWESQDTLSEAADASLAFRSATEISR